MCLVKIFKTIKQKESNVLITQLATLNSHINDFELSIQGYKFERKDRANKSGGGLIVYVKESISLNTRRYDLENTIESIWIQITFTNTKPFLINFVYRPPDSRQDWIDIYENQFRSAVNQFPEIFIFGDFNILFTSNNTCCNSKWSTFYSKYSLTQLITEPTRVTQNTSSIIDHIYTTYPDQVCLIFWCLKLTLVIIFL